MNLNQFAIETFPDWIGFLLIVGVALWGGWQMLEHYLEHTPLIEDAPHYPVHAQQNMADLIAGMQSLRTNLPQYRNQTTPSYEWDELLARMGVPEEDRADVLKGTKL